MLEVDSESAVDWEGSGDWEADVVEPALVVPADPLVDRGWDLTFGRPAPQIGLSRNNKKSTSPEMARQAISTFTE
jgi:hypothetical protein